MRGFPHLALTSNNLSASMADVSLKQLFELPPHLQPDALRKLQRGATDGDNIANVKFLLGQALQACQTPWTEDQHDIASDEYPLMLMNALTLSVPLIGLVKHTR